MPTFEWVIPPAMQQNVTDDTPDAVKEYLSAQGNAATKVDVVGNPYRLVIVAPTDPTAALNAYAGQPSAKRDVAEKAKQIAGDYQAKVLANQPVTLVETAKAVAAIITIVKRGGFDT